MGRSLGVSRVDSDCSHEMKRCLLLGRKAMTNLELIKKQRHPTPVFLPGKIQGQRSLVG